MPQNPMDYKSTLAEPMLTQIYVTREQWVSRDELNQNLILNMD